MAAKTVRLAFRTLHGPWTADGEGPYDGDIVIEDASPDLARLASHAHAAGALEVSDGLDLSTVQTQADGEAAHDAAKGEWVAPEYEEHRNETGDVTHRTLTRHGYWTGPWHEGNLRHQVEKWQHEISYMRGQLPVLEDGAAPDEPTAVVLQAIAVREARVAQAEQALAEAVARNGEPA